MGTTLDQWLPLVTSNDTRSRLQAYNELHVYLSDDYSSLYCDDMNNFVDGLAGWINSSNFKISLNGIGIIALLVKRMATSFSPYVGIVLPPIIGRLGDNRDEVREQALMGLLQIMEQASSPQLVFDRIASTGFTHKLWRVKEQVLVGLQRTIERFGSKSLQLNKLVPSVVKLLDDQSVQVRDEAINSLVEIYRHVGERVRSDLCKKGIPPKTLNPILNRFDQEREQGNMVATGEQVDDTDFGRPTFKAPAVPAAVIKRASSGRKSMFARPPAGGNSTVGAGAMDVNQFTNMFEDVPVVHLFSSRDLHDFTQRCKDMLSDTNHDWEKRTDTVKSVRGLLIAGAPDYDDFYQCLRQLEPCFQLSLKDLRSQVVRETCVTIAYLSQQLGNKFDHFAETMLPNLITLIPNSAKIMATSGTVCIKFILQHTFATKLIPIITSNITVKASIIRRTCFEYLEMILLTWPTHFLERHIAILQESIKKGIGDADSETRVFARRAYWAFAEHFKDQANSLLNSLDSAKQKALMGELTKSGSSGSINNCTGSRSTKSSARSVSTDRTDYYSGSSRGSLSSKGASHKLEAPARQRTRSITGNVTPSPITDRSRPRSRVGVSQSQPTSRSGSPSSRMSYLSNIPSRIDTGMAGKARRSSGIPRSQGTSREASPSRLGRERRLSTSGHMSGAQRVPKGSALRVPGTHPNVSEQAVVDALSRNPVRRRFDNYDSDDNASETSSICSERSYSSSYGRTGEDVAEVLSYLSSGSWSDRKEGLVQLSNLLNAQRYLNRKELKKITEVFTRMFHDPHGKVFSLFLETLIELIHIHKFDLQDWLYILITRLLNKQGSDMLGSVQARVHRVLETVRESFPYDAQFSILTRFIVDQSQSPSLKVKVGLLQYIQHLVMLMDPADFSNTSDNRLAVTRFITWTSEPKSLDVRKAAQAVLIALFNLNTPEFSNMLSALPKSFQETATKILHHHLRSTETGDVLSPRNISSPANRANPSPRLKSPRMYKRDETENMNPEDIYNSIRKASADIQNLSFNSKLDHHPYDDLRSPYDDLKKVQDSTSQDSGIQNSLPDVRQGIDSPDNKKTSYNPSLYMEDSVNGYDRAALAEAVFDADKEMFSHELPTDHNEMISEILTELSNHNTRYEERKNAMLTLIKLTREGTLGIWHEHFKTVLLLLLETLGDNDSHVRALALRVLREIIRHQTNRVAEYTELTIVKILESHRDTVKEVVRAAEECSMTLAKCLDARTACEVLCPIINTADFPVNLAAIKMQTKVIELLKKQDVDDMLDDILPGLLKGYDSMESSVRKASVFCLVALYIAKGDSLREQLRHLNGSKLKLLNLYIKRAETQKNQGQISPSKSSLMSPTSSEDQEIA